MFFRRFFSTPPETRFARELYAAIVAKARQPFFYAELQVPDTAEGRFEMIALHAFLVIDRLSRGGAKARDLSQRLFDTMFADMDRSLREMGVGDLSVGAKVRRMAEAFYGRARAYRGALEQKQFAALDRALSRNIYGEGEALPASAWLARYVTASARSLENQSDSDLLAGRVHFPGPEQFRA